MNDDEWWEGHTEVNLKQEATDNRDGAFQVWSQTEVGLNLGIASC